VKRVKAAKDNFILGEVDDVMQVRGCTCACCRGRRPHSVLFVVEDPRGTQWLCIPRIWAGAAPLNVSLCAGMSWQVLEDSKITTSMILSSRYVSGIK
jgi:hypothetical protein